MLTLHGGCWNKPLARRWGYWLGPCLVRCCRSAEPLSWGVWFFVFRDSRNVLSCLLHLLACFIFKIASSFSPWCVAWLQQLLAGFGCCSLLLLATLIVNHYHLLTRGPGLLGFGISVSSMHHLGERHYASRGLHMWRMHVVLLV